MGWAAVVGAFFGPRLVEADLPLRALAFAAVLSIGLVEGSALGLVQGRGLAARLPLLRRGEWMLPTVLFAAIGWGLGMAGAVGSADGAARGPEPAPLVTLALAALMGAICGPLLGAAQYLVLRHHARSDGPMPARRWILLQIPGWALAMPAIFAGFTLPPDDASDALRIVSACGGGALAGALLGLVTLPFALGVRPWVDGAARLDGRRALVTGASVGIGRAVAEALVARGCSVVLVSRDRRALEGVKAGLLRAHPGANVATLPCDLSSRTAVSAAATELCAGPPIDFVVHAAAATFAQRSLTDDGEERTLAVDVLGPARLTRALASHLTSTSRVVVLTGIYQRRGTVVPGDLHFATRPYSMAAANAQAQRARLVWVAELGASHLAFAVHPGAVFTRALEGAPRWARVLAHTLARPAFVRAELGALPALRLLIDPIEELAPGRFYDRFTLTEDAPREGERLPIA